MSVSSPPAVTHTLPPQSSRQSRWSEHLSLLCYAHRRYAGSRENVEGGKKFSVRSPPPVGAQCAATFCYKWLRHEGEKRSDVI